jgi:hypothetical protein
MFILYETTCLVNGKKYIGVHHRDDDGYLGSGNLIKKAIKRYGKGRFTRQILHKYNTANEAYQKECELVTEEIVASPEYYNLTVGGRGSDTTGIKNTLDKSKYSKASKNRWQHPGYREKVCEKMRQNWNRTPERLHKLRTQNIGRKISPKHIDDLRRGRDKTVQRYNIEGDNICYICLTLREFCVITKLNLASCRQCVWKKGTYKNYTFKRTSL